MKIQLEVLGIRYMHSRTPTGAYVLIMGEIGGLRRVRIIIGMAEAQSIALQLKQMDLQRPLTHDLFRHFLETFNIRLIEISICKFDDGMFFSDLMLDDGQSCKHIDARTSDAVALAMRIGCPIYITEEIMEQVSEISAEEDLSLEQPSAADYSLNDLRERLNEAVKNEDYELASAIRDEIKKLEKQ
ncbi:MAG: bifunctional nuclease family protein [Bacteroidales bacterium]|nr:bifunctional nuclease family protein [Bacteroidales bacterium]